MYEFGDTTNCEELEVALPAEAMQINGRYLEMEVPGYRTLRATGRELQDKEVRTTRVGNADGTRYRGRRYEERVLRVQYQLLAKDANAFRTAFNTLNRLLDVEEAQLIFEDEADKFFVGTPERIRDVEPGRNNITGEFSIVCTDPFKYSVHEFEVEPSSELEDETTFLVDYNGDVPAHPRLEATMTSDNGFLGFINEREHILQFGNVDDAEVMAQVVGHESERLIRSEGAQLTQAPWVAGGSYISRPHFGTAGTANTTNVDGRTWLRLTAMGSGGTSVRGHLRTFTLPQDRNGDVGA